MPYNEKTELGQKRTLHRNLLLPITFLPTDTSKIPSLVRPGRRTRHNIVDGQHNDFEYIMDSAEDNDLLVVA